ncbi:MAG: hypothetical protein WA154_12870 [Moraxellaceae bacterium]
MTDIYAQHEKAFGKVSAFVVLEQSTGERVATIAIKFPQDGAGRLWAYTHLIGVPMTRAHADGYGYDKRSPAVRGGFAKVSLEEATQRGVHLHLKRIVDALGASDGEYWDRLLDKAGYRVLQAV